MLTQLGKSFEFVLLPHSYNKYLVSVMAFLLQNYILTLENNTAMFLGYFAIHGKYLDNLKYYLYMLGLGDILKYPNNCGLNNSIL